MDRRSYNLALRVNGRSINEVIIDPHYESNHPDINDELILELVKKLDGRTFPPVDRQDDWEFFMVDRMKYNKRFYRLVWCMQDRSLFIGIINAFRR